MKFQSELRDRKFLQFLDSRPGPAMPPEVGLATIACDGAVEDREEYVMWGFTARRKKFAFAKDDAAFTSGDLKSAVQDLMGDWHAALPHLVQRTDPSINKTFSVKTSVPVAPWKTRNVTVLGDALQNMPPFRGVGANSAVWDAAALRQSLVAADRGETDLLKALGDYERSMIDHGFRAVRTSLKDLARFHAEGWLERTITKGFFRAVDLIPAIRTIVLEGPIVIRTKMNPPRQRRGLRPPSPMEATHRFSGNGFDIDALGRCSNRCINRPQR